MPSNRTVRVMPDGSTRVGDEAWPQEVRDLAFELWYMVCNRKITGVIDYLNSMPDQSYDHPADDLAIEHRDVVVDALRKRKMSKSTLYQWMKSGNWEEEADKRHRALAPALYQRVDQAMEWASIDAANAVIALVRDDRTPHLTRLKAAESILDRTGHTAWVRPDDDGKVAGPQRDFTESIAGKSGEDLLKMILAKNKD